VCHSAQLSALGAKSAFALHDSFQTQQRLRDGEKFMSHKNDSAGAAAFSRRGNMLSSFT